MAMIGKSCERWTRVSAARAVCIGPAKVLTQLQAGSRCVVGRCFSSTHQNGSSGTAKTTHYDVVITGGGVVGSTIAKVLNERMPRLSVALLERGMGPTHSGGTTGTNGSIPNPRSYALSPKSLNLLGPDIVSDLSLGYYDSMQVWEQNSAGMLLFSKADVGSEFLGGCVEDSALVAALWNRISDNTACQPGTSVESFRVVKEAGNNVEITDTSGQRLLTPLFIAADGANSAVRQRLGVQWRGLDYGRTAVTTTFRLNRDMPKRAFQRFFPNGPLALLPTRSPRHATIVWSTTPEKAMAFREAGAGHLATQVNEALGQGPQRMPPLFGGLGPTTDGEASPSGGSPRQVLSHLLYGMERVVDTIQYGMAMRHWSDDDEKFMAPPTVEDAGSPVYTFPLSCRFVDRYVSNGRIALVGDAAHTVHPMAGQGLNLGLEDVSVLVDSIQKAYDCGMDVATYVEQDYQKDRRLAITSKVAGIHMLHELFRTDQAPALHAKSAGMHLINHAKPVREQLAKIATGL